MIMHANIDAGRSPIAIFGWGLSGKGAASLAERMGITYDVFDQNTDLKCKHSFTEEDALRYRTVVCSPGFASAHPWLRLAKKENCECVTEIEFASRYWQGPLVAVTGTNGKTSVAGFLAYALRSIGKPAVGTGNIGNCF